MRISKSQRSWIIRILWRRFPIQLRAAWNQQLLINDPSLFEFVFCSDIDERWFLCDWSGSLHWWSGAFFSRFGVAGYRFFPHCCSSPFSHRSWRASRVEVNYPRGKRTGWNCICLLVEDQQRARSLLPLRESSISPAMILLIACFLNMWMQVKSFRTKVGLTSPLICRWIARFLTSPTPIWWWVSRKFFFWPPQQYRLGESPQSDCAVHRRQ